MPGWIEVDGKSFPPGWVSAFVAPTARTASHGVEIIDVESMCSCWGLCALGHVGG